MDDIVQDRKISIGKLELGPFSTNTYIVVCRDTGESLIVDVPGEINKILERLKNTIPKYIVITHSHIDHIAGLMELKEDINVPVAIHPLDANNLPIDPDIVLNDGDHLYVGKMDLRILHTPGHTPGSISLLSDRFIISGDTIFPGGPGKTRTPGDFKKLMNTLQNKIFTLPEDTVIYPGHGDSTVIDREKAEYTSFIARSHDPALCGDVLWLSS